MICLAKNIKKRIGKRCDIGCGCNKNRVSRSSRLNRTLAQKRKRINKVIVKKITKSSGKGGICSICPYSAQTKEETKKGLKVCHKTNRLILNLLKDPKFKCPIGKW